MDRQAPREHTTTSSSTKSLGQALRVSLVKPGAYLSESYAGPCLHMGLPEGITHHLELVQATVQPLGHVDWRPAHMAVPLVLATLGYPLKAGH